MTIHSEHPFTPPEDQRDPLRRFRGRLPSPVTVVTTGQGRSRFGLTVSSILVIDGDEPRVMVMVDPDSELGEALEPGASLVVSVLTDGDQFLADAFAGTAPAPGGPFTLGEWVDTRWGPRRSGVSWLGATVESVTPIGWSHQVVALVDHAEVTDLPALVHQRGRYRV